MSVNNYLVKLLKEDVLEEDGATAGLGSVFSGDIFKTIGKLGWGLGKILTVPGKLINTLIFNSSLNAKDITDISVNLSKLVPGSDEFHNVLTTIYKRLLQLKNSKDEKERKYYNELNDLYESSIEREIDKLSDDLKHAKSDKEMEQIKTQLSSIIKVIIDRNSSLIKKINSITMAGVDAGEVTPDAIKKLKELDANLSKLSIEDEKFQQTMLSIYNSLKKAKNRKYFEALGEVYDKHLSREIDAIESNIHEAESKEEMDKMFNRLDDMLKSKIVDKNSDLIKTVNRLIARIKDEEKSIISRNKRWSGREDENSISKSDVDVILKKKESQLGPGELKTLINYYNNELKKVQYKTNTPSGMADFRSTEKSKELIDNIAKYQRMLSRKQSV